MTVLRHPDKPVEPDRGDWKEGMEGKEQGTSCSMAQGQKLQEDTGALPEDSGGEA